MAVCSFCHSGDKYEMVKNNPRFAETSTFICRDCIAICNAIMARKIDTEDLNYFKNK
jgi:hypothetical protein